MKTAELIDHVADAAGVEKNAAKKAVEAVLAGIVEAAKKGDEVNLPGFGKFLRSRTARRVKAATLELARPSRSPRRASSASRRRSK